MTFRQVGLHESLLEGLGYAGFENPTPIQQEAIPAVLTGRDLIACAQTGTGKTGAFVMPVLDYIARNPSNKGVVALIITPTRELALQIEMQIQGLGYFTNANSAAVYGGGTGSEFNKEKEAFSNGTQIIVATPGKLMAHMKMGYVDFSKLKFLILDEADRMLDMGFIDDIEKIIEACPKERQSLLFSATMAPKLRKLAIKMLHQDPYEINLSISKPAAGVTQRAFLIHDNQKLPLIDAILEERKRDSILVFCSRKSKVSEVVRLLNKRGYAAEGISSDLEQKEREDLLLKFRARQLKVLVATDVLSRGIDIQGIELVINFDVPNHPEDYVHRVGRTARAATEGEAITLINPSDMRKFQSIEALIEREIEKEPLPEALGEAPSWNPSGSSSASGPRNKRKPQNKPRRKPQTQVDATDAAVKDAEKPSVNANDRPKRPIRHKRKPTPPKETEGLASESKSSDATAEVAPTTENTETPKPRPKRRRPQRRKKPEGSESKATTPPTAAPDEKKGNDRPKRRIQRKKPEDGEVRAERPKRSANPRRKPQADSPKAAGEQRGSNRASNPYANKSTPDANKGRKSNNNRGSSKTQKVAPAEPKGIKGFFKKLFGGK